MKYKAFIFYAIAFLIFGALFAWVVLLTADSDDDPGEEIGESHVVARVNGVEIRASELNRMLNLTNRGFQNDRAALSRDRREVLDQLIFRKLLEADAERRGLRVTDGEVEEQIERYCDAFGGEEQVRELLQERGIEFDDFVSEVRSELVIGALEDAVRADLLRQVRVTDEQVREYYDQYKDAIFITAEIAHIYIRVREPGGEEEAAALERSEEIIRQLGEGAEFEELARQHSEDQDTSDDGGYLGDFRQVSREMQMAAIRLEPGQHSPQPIRLQSGLHIVKCISKDYIPFEEVSEQIRDMLLQPRLEEAFSEYFDELERSADIQRFLH